MAARLTIFDLDTLKAIGEIPGVGGNGTAVDPESGHGFTSDHPKVSMFDTKAMTLIRSINVGGVVYHSHDRPVRRCARFATEAQRGTEVFGNLASKDF